MKVQQTKYLHIEWVRPNEFKCHVNTWLYDMVVGRWVPRFRIFISTFGTQSEQQYGWNTENSMNCTAVLFCFFYFFFVLPNKLLINKQQFNYEKIQSKMRKPLCLFAYRIPVVAVMNISQCSLFLSQRTVAESILFGIRLFHDMLPNSLFLVGWCRRLYAFMRIMTANCAGFCVYTARLIIYI